MTVDQMEIPQDDVLVKILTVFHEKKLRNERVEPKDLTFLEVALKKKKSEMSVVVFLDYLRRCGFLRDPYSTGTHDRVVGNFLLTLAAENFLLFDAQRCVINKLFELPTTPQG